jgi:hypothetical protein
MRNIATLTYQWAYTNLLTYLLINDNIDKCSGSSHAILGGDELFEREGSN